MSAAGKNTTPDLTNDIALDCANCKPIGRGDDGETVYNCRLSLDLYGGACIGCLEYERCTERVHAT